MILLLSCTSAPTQKTVITESESAETSLPEGTYNGAVPETKLAIPSFTALNTDGSERKQENLLQSPSVLWFFPAASTYG
ncbi:MAG: hypothetical protein CMK59_01645 [Proteobacteria bacterium]|nr:hypothetical protein [Pseudomonadota bacterium]